MQAGDVLYRVDRLFDKIILRKLKLIRKENNSWLGIYIQQYPYRVYFKPEDYFKSAAEAVEIARQEMTIKYHENMRTLDTLSAEEIND